MRQSVLVCLSGLASSALGFVTAPARGTVPNSWTTRSSSSPVELSRRGVPPCMAATQSETQEFYGIDVSKPKPIGTPDDYQFEHGIPDTPMTRRFNHLRGKKVRTVSESVAEFYTHYDNVIISQFRTIVTEYLQSTHLTVYDARFKYDPFFGVGFYTSFMRFMRSYPKEGEADLIFDGIVKALGKGLDAQKMKDDCKTLAAWAEGKTEDDVIAAMTGEGESNIVTEGFYIARTGLGPFGEGWEEKGEDVDWFLYNRLWAVGVFTLIESIGLEPNEELLEKWFAILGTSALGVVKDLNLYQEQLSKVEASEQLFKEIEIREKKRLAERLETKAQDAIKAAERAEREAQEDREEEERIKNAKEGDVLPNDLPKN